MIDTEVKIQDTIILYHVPFVLLTGLTGTFGHVKEPDSRKTAAVLSIEELDIRSMNV